MLLQIRLSKQTKKLILLSTVMVFLIIIYCEGNDKKIFIVSRFNVDLREHSSDFSKVIVRLYRGDKLILLKEYENEKINPELINRYKWYFVETTKHKKGWLKGETLSTVNETEHELLELLKVSTNTNMGEVIFKLGLIKSEKAKNRIIELHNSGYKYACLDALGTYRDKNLIPIFVRELENNSINRIDAIYALGNYLDKDVVRYLIPYLDNSDIFIRKTVFQTLSRFDNKKINSLLDSKRIDLTKILKDLHCTYKEQKIEYISKHLDKENGFYLSLAGEGGYTIFNKKLTVEEAIEFYQGKSKDSKMKSDFFCIHNITDIKVKAIYYYPELVIFNENNEIEFLGPSNLFGDCNILNYDRSIMILVEWADFRKSKIGYHYGAYLSLIQRGDNWYIVGFEQVYG